MRARKPLVIPFPCYLVFNILLKVYKDSTKRFDTPLQLNFTTRRHVFGIEFTLHFFGPSKNLLCYQLLPDVAGLCFTHKVGLWAESYHFVTLKLKFEKPRSSFVVFLVFFTTLSRKPVKLVISLNIHVTAITVESMSVADQHFGSYNIF